MRLTAITLFNWKAYRRAHIKMPPPHNGRNVVIVEGNNGAGKTSLLEAIALCLFGRFGLGIVARAGSGEKSDQSYNGFLERALNASARGQAARVSVALEFEDGDRLLSVERTWHFSAGGRHRAEDEEVRISDGPDLDVVTIPPPPEAAEFVREFISQNLVAENLAGFFLLDGEHVERFAGRSVDEQIWTAIESVLGAPALRALAADLRAYARERRRQLPQDITQKMRQISEEVRDAQRQEAQAADTVEKLLVDLAPLRTRRDEIVRKIGALHGDSYRTFKALFEERESLTRTRDDRRDELRRLLSGDMALALAGPALRKRSLDRLSAEDRTARWETSSQASKSRFDEFISALEKGASEPIDAGPLRLAWDEVWSSKPADCVDEIRHRHLGDADRQAVSDHLKLLSSVRAETISALSREVATLDEQISRCESDIGRQRGNDDESQGLADNLNAVQSQIAEVESQHRIGLRQYEEARDILRTKQNDADLLIVQGESAAPMVARATKAEQFAEFADRLIELALPVSLDHVAEAVTRSYRDMAHKSIIKEVRIQKGKPVELLDENGEDLRNIDASAGESHIFALAVMSALAQLAGDFPIIMDTPLARLDPLHRRNVLNHFAHGSRQLILLTHPAELGRDEMEILEPSLSGILRIGGEPSAAVSGASV